MRKIITLLLFIPLFTSAQTDTIRAKDQKLLTSKLKPGLKQYLVYFQDSRQSQKLRFSLWTREVAKEKKNGKEVFSVTQHWYSEDSATYRYIYSLNDAKTFAPLYHLEKVGVRTRAYNWYPDRMTGADTIPNNERDTFRLDFDLPNFNWNLDIETYEMLPAVEGKTFVFNFYDAGLAKPQFTEIKVIGSETITTLDNQQVACWKLFTEKDFGKVHFTQTFWVSKEGHELLKEEDTFDGKYRYKIKLPGLTPDLLPRFQ